MRTIELILAIVASLLLLSTLICGLWIRSTGNTGPSSLNFHMMIGIATVLFGLGMAGVLVLAR